MDQEFKQFIATVKLLLVAEDEYIRCRDYQTMIHKKEAENRVKNEIKRLTEEEKSEI
jgi:hypothetical protein